MATTAQSICPSEGTVCNFCFWFKGRVNLKINGALADSFYRDDKDPKDRRLLFSSEKNLKAGDRVAIQNVHKDTLVYSPSAYPITFIGIRMGQWFINTISFTCLNILFELSNLLISFISKLYMSIEKQYATNNVIFKIT